MFEENKKNRMLRSTSFSQERCSSMFVLNPHEYEKDVEESWQEIRDQSWFLSWLSLFLFFVLVFGWEEFCSWRVVPKRLFLFQCVMLCHLEFLEEVSSFGVTCHFQLIFSSMKGASKFDLSPLFERLFTSVVGIESEKKWRLEPCFYGKRVCWSSRLWTSVKWRQQRKCVAFEVTARESRKKMKRIISTADVSFPWQPHK